MFKKLNTKVLLVVLVALIGAYLLIRHYDRSERSFKEIIVEFDAEDVDGLTIVDPQNASPVMIEKEGDRWFVVLPDGRYPADTNVVKNIVDQVGSLKTKRFAGKGEELWEKYQVTDSAATIVELTNNNETLTKLLIGRFSYIPDENQNQQQIRMGQQQPRGEMTSYVRLADEKEVYAVDGFLKMNFNRDANSYRDKTLVNVNQNDIQRVIFNYPGRQMTLSRIDTGWDLNGIPADSAKTVNYLRSIARLSNSNFLNEDFSGFPADYRVNIEGNNFVPVELTAFPVSDTNINFVISSSHNPTAYFNGKSSDLFKKIFVDETELLGGKR